METEPDEIGFVPLSADVAPQMALFASAGAPAPVIVASTPAASTAAPVEPEPEPELSAFERRAALRAERHTLVSNLRRLDGRSHAEINGAINRSVGIKRVEDATIDQLQRSIKLLLRELEKTKTRRAAAAPRRRRAVASPAWPDPPSAPRSSAATSTPPSRCSPMTRVFRSPAVFKPYEGREAVETILRAAFSIFEDFRYTDELTGEGAHGLVFQARVGDRSLEGLDLIRADADGRITEFTVMIRPASGLMAVAERMGAALEAAGVR